MFKVLLSYAIISENLSKSYNALQAVKNLTFAVEQGEVFGLIGPDGAGKTTTMRTLCGLLTPDSGRCLIHGFDVLRQTSKVKEIIGYMPQRFSLYPDLSVEENLRFFAHLFQVPKKEREERFLRLLEFSKLGAFRRRRAQELSGGMKQKLALSCTLIHTPKVLILDEPTTGVDPVSRREFWTILKSLKEEGVTILVSTPYMDEAAKCDRVAFMHKGEILAIDAPGKIPQLFPDQLIEIRGENLTAAISVLKSLSGVVDIQTFGDKLHVSVANADEVLRELKERLHIEPEDIEIVEPSIEDTFVRLMGK